MVGGALTSAVCAQEPGQVEGDYKRVVTEQAGGIQLGGFLVLPDITVSQMYDTNVFATRDNEVDDTLTILYPGISAKSTWEEHQLKFSAGGAFAQYYSNNDEDYDDQSSTTRSRSGVEFFLTWPLSRL